MTLKPKAPEVWEQALFDGRRIHRSDSAAAIAYAKERYAASGYGFTGEPEPEPIEAAKPEPTPEELAELARQQAESEGAEIKAGEALLADGASQPITASTDPEVVLIGESDAKGKMMGAIDFTPPSTQAVATKGKRRARNEDGEFKADDKSTPGKNEAFLD